MIANGAAVPKTHIGDIPTLLTQDARSRGRDGVRRGTRKRRDGVADAAKKIAPRACQRCGEIFHEPTDRAFCDGCLAEVRTEHMQVLMAKGKGELREMRASADDPALTPQARAKLAAAISKRRAENKEWERTHEMPDPSEWDTIRAGLAGVTVSAVQRATGLSLATCSAIKKGRQRPHPRHWEGLRNA